jgi:hypothetical protein
VATGICAEVNTNMARFKSNKEQREQYISRNVVIETIVNTRDIYTAINYWRNTFKAMVKLKLYSPKTYYKDTRVWNTFKFRRHP